MISVSYESTKFEGYDEIKALILVHVWGELHRLHLPDSLLMWSWRADACEQPKVLMAVRPGQR